MPTKTIQAQSEIPAFKNDTEAAAFWERHEVGEGLLSDTPDPDFDTPITRSFRRPQGTVQISLKLERDTKGRLEAVAKAKGIPYQTLLKSFVTERLYEEEKRLNILSNGTNGNRHA
ncbi:MAG: BrnA antitoxin family protein [Deinococcota bacterium]|jgi:predicted DNA binding CopG/RHH family protein|nr:BrnA antitoxin family protein [Deinococcota bacterium]